MSSKKIFLSDLDQNKLKLYVFEMDFMTNQLKLTLPKNVDSDLERAQTSEPCYVVPSITLGIIWLVSIWITFNLRFL